MPPHNKRSRAALRRNVKNGPTEITTFEEQSASAIDNDCPSSNNSSADDDSDTDTSSSSEEEIYDDEILKTISSDLFTKEDVWKKAESKFRSVYAGTSKSALHRQSQRQKAREESMKGSKNLFHYFSTASVVPPASSVPIEEPREEVLERALLDAEASISRNAYVNILDESVQLEPSQKVLLQAIVMLLRMTKLGKPEALARQELCHILNWSAYNARRLKVWLKQWVENRELTLSLRGKHPKAKSLIYEEDIQEDIRSFLRQHRRDVSLSFLRTYLQKSYFPQMFGMECGITVGKETCRRWLLSNGFSCGAYTKSVYVDGHERKDVVEYRQKFLAEMEALQPLLVSVDKENPTGPNLMPRLAGDARPHILVTHDECIFRAHDGKKAFWSEDGHPIILPKGPGRGLMVSDFLTAIDGRLELPASIWDDVPAQMKLEDAEHATAIPENVICRRACQIVEYGKNHQGYWIGKNVVAQVQYRIITLQRARTDFIFRF